MTVIPHSQHLPEDIHVVQAPMVTDGLYVPHGLVESVDSDLGSEIQENGRSETSHNYFLSGIEVFRDVDPSRPIVEQRVVSQFVRTSTNIGGLESVKFITVCFQTIIDHNCIVHGHIPQPCHPFIHCDGCLGEIEYQKSSV